MSTIFACFDHRNPIADGMAKQMLAASQYWQPDHSSSFNGEGDHCVMARAALYNTASSREEQVHQDGNLSIVANARLDNREQLCHALGESNHSLCDGKLILKAFQKWGEQCPEQLLGDFAFVIYDKQAQHLFCARDHFGVKSLFYAHNNQGVLVSNEHNAFFTTGWVEKKISESWIIQQLWGLGPTQFQSSCSEIALLPAAHCMTVDSNGIKLRRFWQLEDKNDWKQMDDEALIALLKERFQHAVQTRLESDYPLGAELSEGVDSNGIVGFAAQMLGAQPLHTFSYSCEELTDENQHIWGKTYQDIYDMLAMHSNLKPIWTQNEAQPQPYLADFQHHCGTPLPIRGGHFHRSLLASELGIRTMLSGWGGDHCVSTYGDSHEDELFRRGRWLSCYRLLKGRHKRKRSAHPLKAMVYLLMKNSAPPLYRWRLRSHFGLEASMWESARQHPLKARYRQRYHLHQQLRHFTDNYRRHSVKAHHVRELFEVGVESRLIDSELTARLFHVEYRYPMLDVPLVELAYNMPSHLKIHHGLERYMFRRILEGVTTERIQWRVKADVQHPQFDRKQKNNPTTTLLKQFHNSKLIQRYCDEAKLEEYSQQGGGLKMVPFEQLLHIEGQIAKGEARLDIVEK